MTAVAKWWIDVTVNKYPDNDTTLVRIYYKPDTECDVNGMLLDDVDDSCVQLGFKALFPYSAFRDLLREENVRLIIDPDFISSILKKTRRVKGLTHVGTTQGVRDSKVASFLSLDLCYRDVTESRVKQLCQRLGKHIIDMFNERGFVVKQP